MGILGKAATLPTRPTVLPETPLWKTCTVTLISGLRPRPDDPEAKLPAGDRLAWGHPATPSDLSPNFHVCPMGTITHAVHLAGEQVSR